MTSCEVIVSVGTIHWTGRVGCREWACAESSVDEERKMGRQAFLRDKVWMVVIGSKQKGSVEGDRSRCLRQQKGVI